MAVIEDCSDNSPVFGRQVEPVMLVGSLPDFSPVLMHADLQGNLLIRQGAGMGWTVAGDTTTVNYDDPVKDIYSLRVGGLTGTVVQTITIEYHDTSKNKIISVART